MFDYIRGKLTVKEISRLCVEAFGVGYEIQIPLSTFEKLPDLGDDVKILTHYYVREDTQKLFGFWDERQRDMFRLLIGITKIGPKVALSVLSGISVEELIASVSQADPTRLEKIPGVGAKTAQRMVLELKGKVNAAPARLTASTSSKSGGVVSTRNLSVRDEANAAMVALGYNDKQVARALSRVEQTLDKEAPVEEWIRKSLQVI
jgi:Holliday junction DNA helicase RuvA